MIKITIFSIIYTRSLVKDLLKNFLPDLHEVIIYDLKPLLQLNNNIHREVSHVKAFSLFLVLIYDSSVLVGMGSSLIRVSMGEFAIPVGVGMGMGDPLIFKKDSAIIHTIDLVGCLEDEIHVV